MSIQWDYTKLANSYIKRPDYSSTAIDSMLKISGISETSRICDVGAGVGHLTLMLSSRGFNVCAVEPNDAMRNIGIKRLAKQCQNVVWHKATAENTGQCFGSFDFVTFGSSFNVCDRSKAMVETARILKPKRWFACLWNHRSLVDPIQREIEDLIQSQIPEYGYGSRREDQTFIIRNSGLFESVLHVDSIVIHKQNIEDCIEAWRSHATLQRQAGPHFNDIIERIEYYLKSLGRRIIEIPYTTNIWMARKK